ncbi:hypothetical protein VP395_09845 [Mariniflexile soesokkakense]|uniref:Uncharacterized protein n=1 Tax=Mariniflexile soesokkakense TaxID=1343160 RepID=A0ABV0AEV8_9FLAO
MQKHQNIKALFFLSIFSMLLMHQVVPHWHHQHQGEHQHNEVAHSHNHEHHHETPEKDTSKKGFFDWFVEMPVHTHTTTDVLVSKESTVKKITVEKESVRTLLPETVNLALINVDTSNERWYHPPDKLQNTYFPNCSLRGPPSLG